MRKNTTKTTTTTTTDPQTLVLRLRPLTHLDENKLEEVIKSSADGNECEKRIRKITNQLSQTVGEALEDFQRTFIDLIPHDEEQRLIFEAMWNVVEEVLDQFSESLVKHLNDVKDFYLNLWKDYKNGAKDTKKKSSEFNDQLKKSFETILKSLDEVMKKVKDSSLFTEENYMENETK